MIVSSLAGFAVGCGFVEPGRPGAEPSPKSHVGRQQPAMPLPICAPTRDAEHAEAARTKTISWVRLIRGDVLIVFLGSDLEDFEVSDCAALWRASLPHSGWSPASRRRPPRGSLASPDPPPLKRPERMRGRCGAAGRVTAESPVMIYSPIDVKCGGGDMRLSRCGTAVLPNYDAAKRWPSVRSSNGRPWEDPVDAHQWGEPMAAGGESRWPPS